MTEQVNKNLEQNKKVKEVWSSYFKWFMYVAVLATFASILACYLNIYLSFTALQIRIIQILSIVLEAAPLGQRGHNIQTWSGVSPAEKLDGLLFIVLTSIGFFLIVFSFQLESPPSIPEERPAGIVVFELHVLEKKPLITHVEI